MSFWEVIARRLRAEGWNIWQSTCRDACGQTHIVHVHRPGAEWTTYGPTPAAAFAEAARKVFAATAPAGPAIG